MSGRALVPPGASPARRFPALSQGPRLVPQEEGALFFCSFSGREGRVVAVTVFNRRNALLGYATWMGIKVLAKQKARTAVPNVDRDTKRPNKSAIALATLAVVGGSLAFWKIRSGDESA